MNAACLVLIDAGVSLSSFVVASTCCLQPGATQELIVDPTLEEQQEAQSLFTVCFDGSLKDIVMSESHGEFTQKTVRLPAAFIFFFGLRGPQLKILLKS